MSGPPTGLDSAPTQGAVSETAPSIEAVPAVLEVSDLVKDFPLRSGVLRRVTGSVRAVDQVSLRIDAGRTLGLVGESGSGKSTLARLVIRLIDSTGGTVVVDGKNVTSLRGPTLRRHRESMQMVFQDPYSSLDPKQSIADIVGEPLAIHTSMSRTEREQRVVQLLAQVGLGSHVLPRQPHEFSGGQRQRIAIARALALEPRLLVCDEPVSALDVSTQSQVINLLTELQHELGVAYLFIAHDLSVVRHISDRIAVMYLGQIVEEGDADEVYERPTHPYTTALLSSIPVPDPARQHERKRIILQGEVSEMPGDVQGCRFRARCPFAMEVCAEVEPEPYRTPAGTTVRCHLHTSGPMLAGDTIQLLGDPSEQMEGNGEDTRFSRELVRGAWPECEARGTTTKWECDAWHQWSSREGSATTGATRSHGGRRFRPRRRARPTWSSSCSTTSASPSSVATGPTSRPPSSTPSPPTGCD